VTSPYRAPRRLNAVTITLLLIAVGAGYWFWRFFPAYFDAWTVDHALREAANAIYKASRLREPDRSRELREIVNKTRKDIIEKAGVKDPNLEVEIEFDDNTATATANYTVVVTHPGTTRTTTLHFKRKEQANIKQVRWD
jgi:uncharacterized membrane protein YhiD involved in acid resistance